MLGLGCQAPTNIHFLGTWAMSVGYTRAHPKEQRLTCVWRRSWASQRDQESLVQWDTGSMWPLVPIGDKAVGPQVSLALSVPLGLRRSEEVTSCLGLWGGC